LIFYRFAHKELNPVRKLSASLHTALRLKREGRAMPCGLPAVKGCERERIAFLAFLLAALVMTSISTTRSQQEMSLMGRVSDALTDKPLNGAVVSISGQVLTSDGGYEQYSVRLSTNETGCYVVNLQKGHYLLTVVADYPETPGIDYVPGFLQIDMTEFNSSDILADFHLFPGSSIRITGSEDFIELGRAPEDVSFGVTDTHNDTPSLGQSLTYYDPSISEALGLQPDHIVVPANMPILLYGESSWGRFVVDNNGSYFIFGQGTVRTIDISEAVMNRNIEVVRVALNSTSLRAREFGLSGIDVKSETDDLETAFGYLGLARLALHERSYSQCYMDLRSAYMIYQGVKAILESILSDVSFSPIPIFFLIVLSSFGLASILIERDRARICSGLAISLLFLGFSYYVAPGWRLADPTKLLASTAIAALLAIGIAILFPRIKSDTVTPSGIALVASLISTFSLATRNLKRRRLRSSLILASIFSLVFGFTVFTSFQLHATVAYGRPATPYPSASPPIGLMVVPPPSPPTSAFFPTSIIEALKADPIVATVAPKSETSPAYLDAQLISESGQSISIRGAIGVSSEEAKMSHLDAAVIEGHYMAEEEHAILISKRAAVQLHVVPGDKVEFSWRTSTGISSDGFMVAGILDDQIFGGIVDLDGQPIRPYFIVDHNRAYLSPESVVVLNWQELTDLNLGTLTRINVQTKSANEIVPLANELARKWRYFVYATVDEEVKIFAYRKDPTLLGGSAIPMVLVLVGLNILACSLNAVYERRKEIATLSLVGLNPSQISYMFLAEAGLVAFIGGMTGYLFGIGVPRVLFVIGGPGFLTEKFSWTWSIAVILMAAVVTISASIFPAIKASTLATPHLPLKWKIDYIPAQRDVWLLHIPQVVSKPELGYFVVFIEGKFEEMQLLRTIPEKMVLEDLVDESDQEMDVRKLLFAYSFAQEGSRAFRTENELVMRRGLTSSTYSIDLMIRIDMIYNYNPMDVVWKTASVVRRLMLQWAAAPSSERWGQDNVGSPTPMQLSSR